MCKISVCMATFNGGKYIKKQIESIVAQLNEIDELVIVDDCSTDNTINEIEQINDRRIKLYREEKNSGFIKTFEKALKLAENEYVFLSDQDDVWMDNKVELIKKELSTGIDLVIHNAVVIDDKGNILEKYRYTKGMGNNIFTRHFINNHSMGCLMAFKRRLIPYIIPIPSVTESHDQWIGIIIDVFGFKTKFINVNLIAWIRHENNTSSMVRRGIIRPCLSRIKLFKLVCIAYKRRIVRR